MSAHKKPVLVLNGPNLNMLGVREPGIYGTKTLLDVEDLCRNTAEKCGLQAECRQSNNEAELINWVQSAMDTHSALIINAGAYSHTSIALMDALALLKLPIVEVHISNIHAREEFRQQSYISKVADAVICGCGIEGYAYAMETAAKFIERG